MKGSIFLNYLDCSVFFSLAPMWKIPLGPELNLIDWEIISSTSPRYQYRCRRIFWLTLCVFPLKMHMLETLLGSLFSDFLLLLLREASHTWCLINIPPCIFSLKQFLQKPPSCCISGKKGRILFLQQPFFF